MAITHVKVGLPEKFIAAENMSKGDLLRLVSVDLKNTEVPGEGDDPGYNITEMNKWYLGKYGPGNSMPFGVLNQNIDEGQQIKKLWMFEFTNIVYINRS